MSTDISTLLPGPAARGDGTAYAQSIWSGMTELEQQSEELRAGLHDIDDATGLALDIRGDWVSEPRLGLGDADYRHIIKGREAALGGGALPYAVVHGWQQLTGSDTVTLDSYAGEVVLRAEVSVVPGDDWVARAAAITRDLIAGGREMYAVIYTPDSFLFGVHSFSERGFAADFGSF